MREPVLADVGIGANLGDAREAVMRAADRLAALEGVEVVARSRLYRSAPWQAQGPDYVNAVVRLSTRLTAPDLLRHLQAIERAAGRVRSFRNAPRTLDLDLLRFGQGRISSPGLEVPHPRMWERAFVLLPLRDVDPDAVTPDRLESVADQPIDPISEPFSGSP